MKEDEIKKLILLAHEVFEDREKNGEMKGASYKIYPDGETALIIRCYEEDTNDYGDIEIRLTYPHYSDLSLMEEMLDLILHDDN